MKARIHLLLAALAGALLLTMAACTKKAEKAEEPAPPPPEPAPVELTEVKLGIAIPSYVHAVAWIADDKGFFEKQGLDVEVIVMGGSSATMKGLVSGDLDMGLAGGDAVIKADLAGAKLKVFGGVVNRYYHRLVSAKHIETAEQLKGKSVGLPFLGGPQDMAVQVALAQLGLGYGTDVQIKNMGKEYARLVALDDGLVEAITSAAPPAMLDGMGLHVLADLPAGGEPFPYMMMVARDKDLKERKELLMGMAEALMEGMRFYTRKEAEALALLSDRLGSDKGVPADAYACCGPKLYTYPPYPDEAAMQGVLDFLAKSEDADLARAKEHQAAEYMDLSVLEALKDKGVFRMAPRKAAPAKPGPAAGKTGPAPGKAAPKGAAAK